MMGMSSVTALPAGWVVARLVLAGVRATEERRRAVGTSGGGDRGRHQGWGNRTVTGEIAFGIMQITLVELGGSGAIGGEPWAVVERWAERGYREVGAGAMAAGGQYQYSGEWWGREGVSLR